jgi:hypothetical protein
MGKRERERQMNTEQNRNVRIVNKSLRNVEKFKYLGIKMPN